MTPEDAASPEDDGEADSVAVAETASASAPGSRVTRSDSDESLKAREAAGAGTTSPAIAGLGAAPAGRGFATVREAGKPVVVDGERSAIAASARSTGTRRRRSRRAS